MTRRAEWRGANTNTRANRKSCNNSERGPERQRGDGPAKPASYWGDSGPAERGESGGEPAAE